MWSTLSFNSRVTIYETIVFPRYVAIFVGQSGRWIRLCATGTYLPTIWVLDQLNVAVRTGLLRNESDASKGSGQAQLEIVLLGKSVIKGLLRDASNARAAEFLMLGKRMRTVCIWSIGHPICPWNFKYSVRTCTLNYKSPCFYCSCSTGTGGQHECWG